MTTPTVSEDTRVRLSIKTLMAIIGAVAIGVAAWYSLKADVASHNAQLAAIQAMQAGDHDALKVQGTLIHQQGLVLERIERKLDNIRPRGAYSGGGSQ